MNTGKQKHRNKSDDWRLFEWMYFKVVGAIWQTAVYWARTFIFLFLFKQQNIYSITHILYQQKNDDKVWQIWERRNWSQKKKESKWERTCFGHKYWEISLTLEFLLEFVWTCTISWSVDKSFVAFDLPRRYTEIVPMLSFRFQFVGNQN